MEKKVSLSDGEWKIMNCLWEAPRTITEIVAALREETGWTKHTVIPTLSRMEVKGAVYYEQGERAKRYFPAVPRDDVVIAETHSFLSKVYGGSLGLMVGAMLDKKALSQEELNQLYDVLSKYESKEG